MNYSKRRKCHLIFIFGRINNSIIVDVKKGETDFAPKNESHMAQFFILKEIT